MKKEDNKITIEQAMEKYDKDIEFIKDMLYNEYQEDDGVMLTPSGLEDKHSLERILSVLEKEKKKK